MEDRDERPWEATGAVRRDCKPHRQNLLWTLAILSASLGAFSWVFPLAPFALAVSVATWVVAIRDLKKMRAGIMDPAGIGVAEHARSYATFGMTMGGAFLIVGVMIFR